MYPGDARRDSASADPAVTLVRSVYPPHLVDRLTPPPSPVQPRTRPYVTLTYAQSLDGKIAGMRGTQLLLSGPHSMRLTHRLRELHDSILVGVGTVLNDDPQLTARIPDLLPLEKQPRPIILDSALRTPPGCKLLLNAQRRTGQPVTIVHRPFPPSDAQVRARAEALERAGARLVPLEPDSSGALSLPALLAHPRAQQLFGRALMVEGGAAVISSFLASGLVDLLVVTVASVLVGAEGVSATRHGVEMPRLEHVATEVFGHDSVYVCRPVYSGA